MDEPLTESANTAAVATSPADTVEQAILEAHETGPVTTADPDVDVADPKVPYPNIESDPPTMTPPVIDPI